MHGKENVLDMLIACWRLQKKGKAVRQAFNGRKTPKGSTCRAAEAVRKEMEGIVCKQVRTFDSMNSAC